MATPVCAGVVALILEANPLLSPDDVKSIPRSTAQQLHGDQIGYIDAESAVRLARSYLFYPELHIMFSKGGYNPCILQKGPFSGLFADTFYPKKTG